MRLRVASGAPGGDVRAGLDVGLGEFSREGGAYYVIVEGGLLGLDAVVLSGDTVGGEVVAQGVRAGVGHAGEGFGGVDGVDEGLIGGVGAAVVVADGGEESDEGAGELGAGGAQAQAQSLVVDGDEGFALAVKRALLKEFAVGQHDTGHLAGDGGLLEGHDATGDADGARDVLDRHGGGGVGFGGSRSGGSGSALFLDGGGLGGGGFLPAGLRQNSKREGGGEEDRVQLTHVGGVAGAGLKRSVRRARSGGDTG